MAQSKRFCGKEVPYLHTARVRLPFDIVPSSYGAAGALIVILMWVYYSAQIFLFGAEFTKVYAGRRDRNGLTPDGKSG